MITSLIVAALIGVGGSAAPVGKQRPGPPENQTFTLYADVAILDGTITFDWKGNLHLVENDGSEQYLKRLGLDWFWYEFISVDVHGTPHGYGDCIRVLGQGMGGHFRYDKIVNDIVTHGYVVWMDEQTIPAGWNLDLRTDTPNGTVTIGQCGSYGSTDLWAILDDEQVGYYYVGDAYWQFQRVSVTGKLQGFGKRVEFLWDGSNLLFWAFAPNGDPTHAGWCEATQ